MINRLVSPTSLLAALAMLSSAPTVAMAEFRLGIGDAVEISIAGAPDLKTRSTIDLDGNIMVPLVGSMPASGLSIAKLREDLRRAFTDKAVSVRGSDGRTVINPISPEDVLVSIAEYRPVYVSGAVIKSGEVAYRPGLTIRQAMSIAGNSEQARSRTNGPEVDAISYKADLTVLSSQIADDEARRKYLESELKRLTDAPNADELSKQAVAPPAQLDFVAERMRMERDDFKEDLAHLQKTSKQLEDRSSSLNEQKAKEEEGLKADAEDFERAKSLLEKGTTSIQRVTDARRAMLLSATRALQTEAEAARAALDREGAMRSAQKLYEQRRIKLLADLQDNSERLARAKVQLAALREKLLVVGALKSAMVDAPAGPPQLVVHRKSGDKVEQVIVSEDAQLLPGDVVEVLLPTN